MRNLFVFLMLLFIVSVDAYASTTIKDTSTSHRYASKNICKISAKQLKLVQYKRKFLTELKYDQNFKKYTKEYLPYSDYKLLKALCTIESNLNPKAISKEGALGLCQLMPNTFSAIKKRANIKAKTGHNNPDASIHAAAFYLNQISSYWDNYTYDSNKVKIILASYNAGIGNVNKAKKLCKSSQYEDIMPCLKKVTGNNSTETIIYVQNVLTLYNSFA